MLLFIIHFGLSIGKSSTKSAIPQIRFLFTLIQLLTGKILRNSGNKSFIPLKFPSVAQYILTEPVNSNQTSASFFVFQA